MRLNAKLVRAYLKVWPPYVGAGIKVEHFAEDGSQVIVSHKPRLLTKNGVGTAFGGTMMSMTDPFYMLASMVRLGPDYIIWDTAAEISFLKPGRGRIRADMRIDNDTFELIKAETAGGDKYRHWFEVDIVDEQAEVVARVRRQVYYRRKKK